MKLITNLAAFKAIQEKFILAVGNFDGLHIGHQKLLSHFIANARENSLKTCVLTFKPHPKVFFDQNLQNFLLMDYETKVQELKIMGVDYIFELPFTEKIQSTTAKEFIREYFDDNPYMQAIHLGHDFALGMGKEDAYDLLQSCCHELKVYQEPRWEIDGVICSSTLIRECLSQGEVERASTYLGRHFSLSGEVIYGLGVGNKELVPTANLAWNKLLITPKPGVYFTKTLVDNEWYDSITNIGYSPTVVDNGEKRVETYLLDFSQTLYSAHITVEFLAFHREEMSFSSKQSLLDQINSDVQARRNYA